MLLNGVMVAVGTFIGAASFVLGYADQWAPTIDGLLVGAFSAVLAALRLRPSMRHRHPWPIIVLGAYGLLAPTFFGYAWMSTPRFVLGVGGLSLIVLSTVTLPHRQPSAVD